jgi:hypothetical protein
MLKGVLADANIVGHVDLVMAVVRAAGWIDLWDELAISYASFQDVGLGADATDAEIWQVCQREHYVLVTSNRNEDAPDSLESTIRSQNTAEALPVLTIADPERLRYSREYVQQVAESLLAALIDIDFLQGAGRLYLPETTTDRVSPAVRRGGVAQGRQSVRSAERGREPFARKTPPASQSDLTSRAARRFQRRDTWSGWTPETRPLRLASFLSPAGLRQSAGQERAGQSYRAEA